MDGSKLMKQLIIFMVAVGIFEVSGRRFGSWSDWQPCQDDCLQSRVRSCVLPELCRDETQTEQRSCPRPEGSVRACAELVPGHVTRTGRGRYSHWSPWSACTRSCRQKRYRNCVNKRHCRDKVMSAERSCVVPGTSCRADKTTTTTKTTTTKTTTIRTTSTPPTKAGQNTKVPVTSGPTFDPGSCGLRPSLPDARIVGGRQSRRHSWPWVVVLINRFGEQYCGGALIAPQYVLTAAHCVMRNGRRRRYVIRVSEHDLGVTEGHEQDFRSVEDYYHPDYNEETIENDIAVVKLPVPVFPSAHAHYACVPGPDDLVAAGTLCTVVGWGKMKHTHLFGTDVLREARVPIVSQENCSAAFQFPIEDTQLCAGHSRGGRDACSGDSGGPLLCLYGNHGNNGNNGNHGNRRWHVYGVTSFGEGCGDPGKFGVYTKVVKYSNWINEIIKT